MTSETNESPNMGPNCSMSIIPIDTLASDILPRLPPRTLLRLKSLNKFFYNYISSKQFIDLHLRHFASSNTNGLFIVFTALSSSRCLYLLDVDSPNSSGRYITLPQPFCDKGRYFKVVGSCNGLLCLDSFYVYGKNLMYYAMVLNPSTGKVLINTLLSTEFRNTICSGFVYDRLNDDYKLVVVEYQYHHGEQPDLTNVYRKVSMFSMKSSSWRCIETAYLVDSGMGLQNSPPACVLIGNNFMRWLLTCFSTWQRSIVCFNCESEQWASDVALPDFVKFECWFGCEVNLGVLDGCLCLSVYETNELNVWIMKDYGVQGSWTRFSIAIHSHHLYKPIFACYHTPIREMLLTKSNPTKLGIQTYVWYNLREKIAKEVLEVSVTDNLSDISSGAPHQLEAQLLCVGSLVTGFVDGQSSKCKQTQERMEIDNQVKITTRQPGVAIMIGDDD